MNYEDEKLEIVFIGSCNSGKTTIINRIIGKTVMPASSDKNTKIVLSIENISKKDTHVIYEKDKELKTYTTDKDVKKFFENKNRELGNNNNNNNMVINYDYKLATNFLNFDEKMLKNIILKDTPGIAEDFFINTDDKNIINLLKILVDSHIFYYIFDFGEIDSGLKFFERILKYLKSMNNMFVKNYLKIIVNKNDRIREIQLNDEDIEYEKYTEDIKEKIEKTYKKICGNSEQNSEQKVEIIITSALNQASDILDNLRDIINKKNEILDEYKKRPVVDIKNDIYNGEKIKQLNKENGNIKKDISNGEKIKQLNKENGNINKENGNIGFINDNANNKETIDEIKKYIIIDYSEQKLDELINNLVDKKIKDLKSKINNDKEKYVEKLQEKKKQKENIYDVDLSYIDFISEEIKLNGYPINKSLQKCKEKFHIGKGYRALYPLSIFGFVLGPLALVFGWILAIMNISNEDYRISFGERYVNIIKKGFYGIPKEIYNYREIEDLVIEMVKYSMFADESNCKNNSCKKINIKELSEIKDNDIYLYKYFEEEDTNDENNEKPRYYVRDENKNFIQKVNYDKCNDMIYFYDKFGKKIYEAKYNHGNYNNEIIFKKFEN